MPGNRRWGCGTPESEDSESSRTGLERPATEGKSPVGERRGAAGRIPSTTGHEESRGNPGGPPSKAKYAWRPIVNQYREGKVKSTAGAE